MNNREFFTERWEAEQPAFLRVLRAVPEGQLRYRPHDNSTTAGALAWQIADEQKQLIELLETGEVTFRPSKHPDKPADIVSEYEKATDELRKRLASVTEAKWGTKANFIIDGNAVWSDSVQNLFWGYLFDMVHHRGQLSAYLRPMGGKVPSIYGPSGDDSGQ